MGLLLVVTGHLYYDSTLPLVNRLIYSFHMPMFFMISGFLTRTGDREPMREFIRKKFWRLLAPAAIYIALGLPLYFLQGGAEAFRLWDLFYLDGKIAFNAPCWYMIVLFEAMLAERALNLAGRPTAVQLIAAGAAFTIGWTFHRRKAFLRCFGFNRMPVALGFLILGILLRKLVERRGERLLKMRPPVKLLAWLGCTAAGYLFGGVLNGKASMYGFNLGRYRYFLASGALGSLSVLMLGFWRVIDRAPLRRWGRNALFVVGTHYIPKTLFQYCMRAVGLSKTWVYNIAAPLFAVALIAMYMPLCEWLDRHVPVLTGNAGKRIVGGKSNADQSVT